MGDSWRGRILARLDEELRGNTTEMFFMRDVLRPCDRVFEHIVWGKSGCPTAVICNFCRLAKKCGFKQSSGKDGGEEFWKHETFKVMKKYQCFLFWLKNVLLEEEDKGK